MISRCQLHLGSGLKRIRSGALGICWSYNNGETPHWSGPSANKGLASTTPAICPHIVMNLKARNPRQPTPRFQSEPESDTLNTRRSGCDSQTPTLSRTTKVINPKSTGLLRNVVRLGVVRLQLTCSKKGLVLLGAWSLAFQAFLQAMRAKVF